MQPFQNKKFETLDTYKNGKSLHPQESALNLQYSFSPLPIFISQDLNRLKGPNFINSNINTREYGNLARIAERQNRMLDKLQYKLDRDKKEHEKIETVQKIDESKLKKGQNNRSLGKAHDSGD